MSLQLKRFASRSIDFDPAWIGFNGLFTNVPREVTDGTPSIGIYQVSNTDDGTVGTFGFSITPWGVVQELPHNYEAHIQGTFITVGPPGHTLDHAELTFVKTVALDLEASGGVMNPDTPILPATWQLNGIRQFNRLDRQQLGVYPAHAVEALLWALRRLKKAGEYRRESAMWNDDSWRAKSFRAINHACVDIRHILNNSRQGDKLTRVPITPEIVSFCVRVERLVGSTLLEMDEPRRSQPVEKALRLVVKTYDAANQPSSRDTLFNSDFDTPPPRSPLTDDEAMEWSMLLTNFVKEAQSIKIPVIA